MTGLETGWRDLISGRTRAWWAPVGRAGLSGLSVIYGGVVRGYRALFDAGLLRTERLPCAVVSIGNITLGGTGKTTTVRWVVRRLREWGLRPAVLSYGYRAPGARTGDRVTVVSGPEGVRQPVEVSGDEPQLLARSLPGVPVLAARKRLLAGKRACAEFGVGACVLDDAFQYWRVEKDLELLLVHAENPFGYGRIFPRGTLRESPAAVRRADAAIVTHAETASAAEREKLKEALRRHRPGMPVAEARHVPVALRDHRTGEPLALGTLAETRLLALSSLGSPGSFERTLAELGAEPAAAAWFPDHHPYEEADLRRVREQAAASGAGGIVTTEKDAVKIPSGWLADTRCFVLEIDLEFVSGQDDIEALLRERTRFRDR